MGDLLRWSSRAKTVCTIQVQVDFIKIDKRSIIFLVDRSSVIGLVQTTKFHETNLKHSIKYMKSLASESVRYAYSLLEQVSRSFRLARPGISTLERL